MEPHQKTFRIRKDKYKDPYKLEAEYAYSQIIGGSK